jgi:Ser/Thr protein kinase RdoA (MazF antagonist)
MNELARNIEDSYGLSIKDMTPIQSSDDNDTYRIKTDTRILFGRLSKRNSKSSASIDSELMFLNYLKSNGLPVAGAFPCEDGRSFAYVGDRPMVLFEWIDGEAGSVSKGAYLSSEKTYGAGRVLAALHNTSARYSVPCVLSRKVTTEFERVISLHDEVSRKYIEGEKFIETAVRLVGFSERYVAHERIVIHNDFRPQNVLFDRNSDVAGIVDFDWMCLAPLEKDLALALVEWAFADGDVSADSESLRLFLRGYMQDIDEKYAPVAGDISQWIEYACLSDAATYISDVITEEVKQGAFGVDQAKEMRSYMLSKAKYFRSIDLEEIFKDIHR